MQLIQILQLQVTRANIVSSNQPAGQQEWKDKPGSTHW